MLFYIPVNNQIVGLTLNVLKDNITAETHNMTGLWDQDLRQTKTWGSRSQGEGSTGLEEHDPRQKGKTKPKRPGFPSARE